MPFEFDEDEFEKIKYEKKVKIKTAQFNEMFSDCLAFRFLRKIIPVESEGAKNYDALSKVCDDRISKFGTPETTQDFVQIMQEIYTEMKKQGWNI